MPIVTEEGHGEAANIGRVDTGHYLQRQGLKYVGATPLPIGFVFISVVPTNPAVLLGYGVWTVLAAGRVLVSIDPVDPDFDTVRKLSGAKTHTLSTVELPAHGHGLTKIRGLGTGGQSTDYSGIAAGVDSSSTPTPATTDSAGSGIAHNNLQPGFAVYMWERIS